MADLTFADVEEIQRYLATTRDDILTWLPADLATAWKSDAAGELLNSELGDGGVPWGKIRFELPTRLLRRSYTRPSTASTRWQTQPTC